MTLFNKNTIMIMIVFILCLILWFDQYHAFRILGHKVTSHFCFKSIHYSSSSSNSCNDNSNHHHHHDYHPIISRIIHKQQRSLTPTSTFATTSSSNAITTTSATAATSVTTTAASTALPLIEPFGKGLIRDIKRKLPYFKSDFIDGFNIKSLSSIFFLFFACLAPAVAFGGLLGIATNEAMGTMEAVGATAIGGVLYSLFSAQPLTIIGTTGPLLAFLKVLNVACRTNNLPFLQVYAWIGIWSSLFLFMSSLFSISNIVEYISRFTDDIFSTLISVIFIYEALSELAKNFMNPTIAPAKSLLSLIVAFTTFFTAQTLSGLRKTPYFNRKARSTISDFAPTLGVLSGIGVAAAAKSRYGISLACLSVPEVLRTTSGRPWLIDIFSLPTKIKLLCILPALMSTVLLFMDQNITVRLMMSKQNKLKKGSGLHLDMFIIAFVTALTSVLGMPWMVAATVRSLAHLRSLQVFESSTPSSVESMEGTSTVESSTLSTSSSTKDFIGVQEQRVTGLMIHTLIGGAVVFCRDLLRQIPVSVLTGLFLYLGISSIDKTDFFERMKLFITDSRDIRVTSTSQNWLKNVGLARTKLFTAIQLSLLGAMWWIKGTSLGVLFPVLIGILAPIRIALEKYKIFTPSELKELDGEIG